MMAFIKAERMISKRTSKEYDFTMEVKCKYCQSDNVYFSKKRNLYVCEDCEKEFSFEKEIQPQKVFLSYGHDDNTEIVDYIYDKLKERGQLPWIDKSEIKAGNDWREKISTGIADSTDLLAFISRHSVRDPGVCLGEISIGVGNWNTRIQSILLEKDVFVPNSISNIQWIDLSDWREYKYGDKSHLWDGYIDAKMKEIIDVVEDESGKTASGNVSMLRKTLNPLTYNIKMRMILRNEIVVRDWIFSYIKGRIT